MAFIARTDPRHRGLVQVCGPLAYPCRTNPEGGMPMKDPVVNEALRQIQDIVRQETGNPLAGTAKSRVERVLTSALGQLAAVRGEDKHLTRDVTILLADLRGFTSISATYPAVIVLELLNRCFVRMSEIIFQHGGGIDKFMGDSILVIFES